MRVFMRKDWIQVFTAALRKHLRKHLRKVQARIASAWRHGPDWLELTLYCGLLSWAWRLSQVAREMHGGDAVGRAMMLASNIFLSRHFETAPVVTMLTAAGLVGIVAWFDDWIRWRYAANAAGSLWWLMLGYVLCRHTPGHLGGTMYLILWGGSLVTWVYLSVQYDREKRTEGAALVFGQAATTNEDLRALRSHSH